MGPVWFLKRRVAPGRRQSGIKRHIQEGSGAYPIGRHDWQDPNYTHLQLIQGQATPPPLSFKRPAHSAAPHQFAVNRHVVTFGSPARLLSSPWVIRLVLVPSVVVHPLFPAQPRTVQKSLTPLCARCGSSLA